MSQNKQIKIQPEKKERLYFRVYLDMWDNDLLTPDERYVYLVLKRYADVRTGQGVVYPTIEDICKKVGRTRKTVSKHLKSLQKKGIIEIKRRGFTQSNLYVIKDRPDMWKAQTIEELRTAAVETELERSIRIIEAAGGRVDFREKEKEPDSIAKPTKATKESSTYSKNPITNPTGYKKKSQDNKQKNKFHNFDQRDYEPDFYDNVQNYMTIHNRPDKG